MNALALAVLRVARSSDGAHLCPFTLHDRSPVSGVPGAVEWLIRATGQDRIPIGAQIAAVMRSIGPTEWLGLHAQLRSAAISPTEVPWIATLPPADAVELLGIATLSSSGFTREAALHSLGRLGHPRGVPYVLLRLGDWVEAVRAAAAQSLRILLSGEVAAELLQHHALVTRLGRQARVDLSGLEREIRSYLRGESGRQRVWEAIASGDLRTRMFCVNLLADELAHRPDLVARLAVDSHAAVRVLLSRRVGCGEVAASDDILRTLLSDRCAIVVATLVRAMPRHMIERFAADLSTLVFSNARTVRRSALTALQGLGHDGVAAQCRDRLDAAATEAIGPGLVECLGETGAASDVPRLLPLLHHPRARVRGAAVTAVGRLDPERAAPVVLRHLGDTSIRVRRAAVAVLRARPPVEWLGPAQDIAERGNAEARAGATRLLATYIDWNVVPSLLRGLLETSPPVGKEAWLGIDRVATYCVPRGWLRPSQDCLERLRLLWPTMRGRISPPPALRATWAAFARTLDDLVAPR